MNFEQMRIRSGNNSESRCGTIENSKNKFSPQLMGGIEQDE